MQVYGMASNGNVEGLRSHQNEGGENDESLIKYQVQSYAPLKDHRVFQRDNLVFSGYGYDRWWRRGKPVEEWKEQAKELYDEKNCKRSGESAGAS